MFELFRIAELELEIDEFVSAKGSKHQQRKNAAVIDQPPENSRQLFNLKEMLFCSLKPFQTEK